MNIKIMKLSNYNLDNYAPRVISYFIVFLIVFIIFSGLIYVSNFNLGDVYKNLFNGAFGTPGAIGQTLIRTSPLLLCSLGLIVAYRCGVSNIGSEGQIYLGALGATLIGVYIPLPSTIHILLAILVSFIFGGLWASIASYLKIYFKANEVIITLMLNFIAIWLIYYFIQYHLKPPEAFNPVSAVILPTAKLPILLPGSLLHFGIIISVLISIVVWFIIHRTYLGYTIDAIGANKMAAAYGGIKVNKVIVISMFISGGLAGIAGMGEVLGVHNRLIQSVSPNYGYLAIAIVLIAKLEPFNAIFVSLFFGALLAGGKQLQVLLGVPTPLIDILVGLFIITMLLQEVLEQRINKLLTRSSHEPKEAVS